MKKSPYRLGSAFRELNDAFFQAFEGAGFLERIPVPEERVVDKVYDFIYKLFYTVAYLVITWVMMIPISVIKGIRDAVRAVWDW